MIGTYIARIGLTTATSFTRGKVPLLAESRMPMRIWPSDIDVYGHVNNGVYLTLMDQGRLDHTLRTGMMFEMLRRGWMPVLGAATVRFRRELRVFEAFEMATRIAYWDDKWVYFAQSFERAEVLHAEGFARAIVKRRGETVSPAELMSSLGHGGPPPDAEEALSLWVASQRAASKSDRRSRAAAH